MCIQRVFIATATLSLRNLLLLWSTIDKSDLCLGAQVISSFKAAGCKYDPKRKAWAKRGQSLITLGIPSKNWRELRANGIPTLKTDRRK